MKKKIIIYGLYILIIVLLQSTVLDYITVYNVKPNLIIIFIISIALLRGNVEGAVVGLFCGMIQDVLSGKVFGFYSLLGLYLGLAIGSVNKRLYRENYLVIIFFAFVSTIGYEFFVCFFSLYIKYRVNLIFAFKTIILPESIFNSAISIFIYALIIRLNKKLEGIKTIQRKY